MMFVFTQVSNLNFIIVFHIYTSDEIVILHYYQYLKINCGLAK